MNNKPGLAGTNLEMARSLYAARLAQLDHFGDAEELVHNPPWDMLLLLYIAHEEQRSIERDELITSSRVHRGTGTRWLAAMKRRELITFEQAEEQVEISAALTNKGVSRMRAFLQDPRVVSSCAAPSSRASA